MINSSSTQTATTKNDNASNNIPKVSNLQKMFPLKMPKRIANMNSQLIYGFLLAIMGKLKKYKFHFDWKKIIQQN